jgi:flavin-binding protein dodecin
MIVFRSTKSLKRIWLALFCLILLYPGLSYSEEVRLINIGLSNIKGDLLLFFNVEGAFRERLKKSLHGGLRAIVSIRISFLKARKMWFDKKIGDMELMQAIRYDNLKKNYIIKRLWEHDQPLITQSFDEANKWMTHFDRLKVHSQNGLEKGKRYQIKLKLKIGFRVTSPRLRQIAVLVRPWAYETDWYVLDFVA